MYLVAGHRYEADEHGLQHALASAHEGRVRPLCLCSKPPLPVYITKLGETFVLKRMPFTGSQHAMGCTHYEPPADLSGLGEVLGSAISEDPDTGLTQLRVGFSLSKGASRTVMSSTGQDRASVRRDGTRLSLRGLLHFLWHEAELTRWHPGFAGRRSWSVVRSHLLAAAANKVVRGNPLSNVLYIPEVFTAKHRDKIIGRRVRLFSNGLQRHGEMQPMMILISEVKEIFPTRFHFKAVVKHVPELPFLFDRQLRHRLLNLFDRELSLWAALEETRMILIATFALSDEGLPMIDELSLMPTTSQWLPVEDRYEQQLIERLVSQGRAFEKMLGFNARLERRSASAILLDVQPFPIALRLDRSGTSAHDSNDPRTGIDDGAPYWLWKVSQSEIPLLPT